VLPEVEVVDINGVLSRHSNDNEGTDDDDDIILAPHITCCVHTLNLIATKDADKVLNNSKNSCLYKKTYRSAFAKVQTFWNLPSRSIVAADMVKEACGCTCPVPNVTRWNSTYDALKKKIPFKNSLGAVCEKLKISNLKIQKWSFPEEFSKAMEPLALSLDKLQV
jgi:hypothetical protein